MAIAYASLTAAQESANVPLLRLDDAVRLATTANLQVQINSLDIRKAEESTAQTKGLRYPQFNAYVLGGSSLSTINFTIPAGTLGVYPGTGPIPGRDASISTSPQLSALIYLRAAQPVSQLYKISLALRETRLGEQAAKENARKTHAEVASSVRSSYYQLAQTQSQIVSAEAAMKFLVELAALTDRHVAEQTALKADSLTVRSKLSQQRYQLLVLRDTLQTQKEAFNRLLARDLRTDFQVEQQALPVPEELDLAASQKTALAQRAEARLARLQVEKSELEVKREHAEYLPDISLQISHLSFPNVNFLPKNITSLGFLLEWQPFDWGQRHHKIEQLKATSGQNNFSRRDVEQQILLDVNSSYRKLAEARAFVETQAAGQEVEREKLRLVLNRHQQKAALLSDVLQQQAAVANADSQYQQALQGFWAAKANFSRALGEN